jgi:exodeoxyribonuclease VII small subunit
MTEATDGRGEEPVLGYEEAIAELEAIVTDLQNDEVGVDELADRVARGARLVELCRDRLRRAELAVDEVVDALRTAAERDAARDDTAPAAEHPAAERPAVERPAAERPAAERDAARDDTAPAAQHPAADEEPSPDDLLF